MCDMDTIYENVANDHLTYTALQRPGPREQSDDHVYGNLNHAINNIQKDYWKTGL